MPSPIPCRWSGDAFEPLPWHKARCDKQYVVGQVYPMIELEERSAATHSHQFAWLHTAWQNLPENLRDLYPTQEHLRKRALIDVGFYDEDVIDVGTTAGALRVAAFARAKDEFALVIVRGPIVMVRTAKSQSRHAMDKATFQKSKEAMMELIAGMIGVTPMQLEAEAGRDA